MSPAHFPRVVPALLASALLLNLAQPAAARIRKSRPPELFAAPLPPNPWFWAPLYSLLVGSGIEIQPSRDEIEYNFPILVEYRASEKLLLALEPTYVSIIAGESNAMSLQGWGDLETAAYYEFLRERRYRPALLVEARVRWPTSEHPDLGEPGREYSFGIIAEKDLVFIDLDLNVLYTVAGERTRADEVEVALGGEWSVTPYLGIIGEVALAVPLGGDDLGQNGAEATAGLAWQLTRHLRFEHGIVFKEGGEWEAVAAWEWSFGGD